MAFLRRSLFAISRSFLRSHRERRDHPAAGNKSPNKTVPVAYTLGTRLTTMSIRDFLKKQFIDVIHWTEPGDGILAWRFPMQDMEIQNGAKLTVRESQMAAFVNEGRVADVFGPGLYTLTTQTLPI